MLRNPANIGLLLIPYLVICGTLYHVAYWDKFGINGLLYISASDIMLSATQPILPTFVLALFNLLLFYYILNVDKIFPTGGGGNTKVGRAVNSNVGIRVSLVIWVVIIVTLYYFGRNPYRWQSWAYIVTFPFWVNLYDNPFFVSEIQDRKIRLILVQSIILLPLLSFATGKQDAELIYRNFQYRYCIKQNNTNTMPATDTLKFIGASSQRSFFSSLDNSSILILSDTDSLVLFDKK
jgi:hypothetical protein